MHGTIAKLFSYNAGLKMPPEVIGEVPEGIRLNFYLTGGSISGERLNGRLEPVGADWLLLRRDGIAVVDVRATMVSHDGALIYTHYTGVLDAGPDGYAAFLEGRLPPTMPIRTAPRFHCNSLVLADKNDTSRQAQNALRVTHARTTRQFICILTG